MAVELVHIEVCRVQASIDALLAPGLSQDEQTELAARAGRALAAAAAWRPGSALPYYSLGTIYASLGDAPSAADALAAETAAIHTITAIMLLTGPSLAILPILQASGPPAIMIARIITRALTASLIP